MQRLLPALPAALLLFLLLPGCGSENPAPAAPPPPVTLSRDHLTLTVEPALGGRIASFTYKGRELLRTERDSADLHWGSTGWTAPQQDWNWPPPATFDRGPFAITRQDEHSIVLESAVDPVTNLQMTKRIRLGRENDIGVTYYVTNRGSEAVTVAAWENTRLPYGGRIEFAADSVRTAVAPFDLAPENDDRYVLHFDDRHPRPAKVFADINGEWVTYHHPNGLILRKTTAVRDYHQVPPTEAPLEIYLDRPGGFTEFELIGEYKRIEFDEPSTLRTRWQVLE